MFDDWWRANRLEIYMGVVTLVFCALLLGIDYVVSAVKQRRRNKKRGLL
jgi:hypothetical protein